MGTPTEIAKQGYAAFGRRDIPALLELLADDVEWRFLASPETGTPYGGTCRGKQQVAEFFGKLAQADEILEFEPREFLERPRPRDGAGPHQGPGAPGRQGARDRMGPGLQLEGRQQDQPLGRHGGHGRPPRQVGLSARRSRGSARSAPRERRPPAARPAASDADGTSSRASAGPTHPVRPQAALRQPATHGGRGSSEASSGRCCTSCMIAPSESTFQARWRRPAASQAPRPSPAGRAERVGSTSGIYGLAKADLGRQRPVRGRGDQHRALAQHRLRLQHRPPRLVDDRSVELARGHALHQRLGVGLGHRDAHLRVQGRNASSAGGMSCAMLAGDRWPCRPGSLLVASSWARARSKSASTGRNSAYMWVACSVGVMPCCRARTAGGRAPPRASRSGLLSAGCIDMQPLGRPVPSPPRRADEVLDLSMVHALRYQLD